VSVSWESFLQEVMPDVSGCPISLAENAIRNAAIEFCNQSRVYRIKLANLNTVDGTNEYTLVTPADTEVISLNKVRLTIDAVPLPEFPLGHQDRYALSTIKNKPNNWLQNTPSTIRFDPVPDAAYEVQLWAILKPTRASVDGPDFLFNDWLEPIAHGAKARLKAMKGRGWYDPASLKFHRRQFINEGWVEARIRDAKSNAQGSTKAAPQEYGFYWSRRFY